ncbi:MAG: protein kinase, partial [Deltaproteobacteria bacterium]|nr:protein kinase [Deltaproteobacteria bacterium]
MGRVISRKYEELGQLGQGGQGVVYKVRHVEHQTVMALKALPAYLLEDQDMVARFEQESVLMTRLQHRNIARVLGTGRDDALNLTYFVMEYIEGRTLKQYLYEKGPLSLSEVLEIARQVASALEYAHTQTPPVIHRDIKPTNIMIEDHTGRVVVLDFGIAKELDDGESRTKTGVMVGTWKYCSPEQLRHEPLSGSADVYSLGIVMYEILTGKQFFAGLDEHAVLGKVLYDPQENIPAFDRPVPPAFAAVVTKAIAKDRAKRYPRMADLSRDLEACWLALDETKTVALSTPPPAVSQPVQERSEIEKIEAQIRQLEEERQRRMVTSLQSQVREARTRAEQEGARQVAAALFEQGLVEEGAGEEHVRHQQYALAQQTYHAALQSFTRAMEEAVSAVLWRQAEQNRQEAANANADADRYLAQTRAAAAYTSAHATHARAEQAWEQRQYAEAGALYVEARDLFEDARDLAYRQTLKEEAEAARTHAHASKQAAATDSAETLAASLFEEGRANEQRATGALAREEFTQAREFFLTAQQKYEQAQRQALRVQQRRQEVLALAGDVEAAQHRAQAEGPEVQEQEGYQQAEQFRQQAEALLAANEFTGAQQRFTQAREQYEEAARALARVRLQQQVTRVRREADTARAGAEAADAQRWCLTEWTAGQHADEVGRSQEAQGELVAAIESYRQAGQHWEQVRQTALTRSAQAQAETARQRVHTVKEQARPLRSWADAQWQVAHEHETQGDTARQAGDYDRAAAAYAQAERDYDRARTEGAERQRQEAEEQRGREQARIAKEQTWSAQTDAREAGAQELAREIFEEAWTLMQQAERALSAEEFLAAVEAYQAAEARYHQAREHAQTESLRRDTVTSAQLTETTRQRAAAFGKQSETNPSYRQARERHQHAEQRFQAREYAPARQAYEQARVLYDTAIHEAERELQRTVTRAREAAVKARQGAERHEAPRRVADQWATLLAAEQHAQASEARGEIAAAIKAWQELEVRYVHIRETALEHAALERVT